MSSFECNIETQKKEEIQNDTDLQTNIYIQSYFDIENHKETQTNRNLNESWLPASSNLPLVGDVLSKITTHEEFERQIESLLPYLIKNFGLTLEQLRNIIDSASKNLHGFQLFFDILKSKC